MVQTVLLQIASGIKDLHGLCIVHGDLKPENLFLADSRKSKRKGDMQESVFEIFSQGDYVAQTWGCKQLMGQNSFGGSAARESSLQMQAANAAGGGDAASAAPSSIVGAGPGTVGWQAPELMVMCMPRRVDYRHGAILKWPKPQLYSPH